MSLLTISRNLRKRQTPWEQKLWRILRNRGIGNAKFRRQFPIGPYVVDFYCLKSNLVIELDGSGYFEERQAVLDRIRDAYLQKQA